MAEEMKGRVVGGEGKTAEVDGGYFGGYVRPANLKERRVDRRFARNQNGKRKVVVIVRERGGNSVPAVFNSESQASAFIRARIAKGTVVHADEAGSWDNLHERFEVKRINHQEAYSFDGACTNWAEEYFSRLRRAEIGVHHHIAGAYLLRYAQESSWREDNRAFSTSVGGLFHFKRAERSSTSCLLMARLIPAFGRSESVLKSWRRRDSFLTDWIDSGGRRWARRSVYGRISGRMSCVGSRRR
jgi:hypothetical protein